MKRRLQMRAAASDNGMEANEEYLVCKTVHKSYGSKSILNGVSFSLQRGEVLALMGRSGSGKSTLLRLINHLERIDSGEILLSGVHIGYEKVNGVLREMKDVAAARAQARIGMVFQQFNLFDHMTAQENIAAALRFVYKMDKGEAMRIANRSLAQVALADVANHYPRHLSGGQQQRVAIARALATKPRLILLDEPTSALDPELAGEVREVIRDLARQGMTMLIATHDVSFARECAGDVMVLSGGVVVERGRADDVLKRPRSSEARSLFGVLGSGLAF